MFYPLSRRYQTLYSLDTRESLDRETYNGDSLELGTFYSR